MKIGVFVGSFDPVHNGHTNVMNYLIDNKIVDKVLVIATNNYWDKQNITALKIRLDMLDFIKSDNIIIDKRHNNVEYTYQILNTLKEENSSDDYYLVIGADNANTLHKWKNYNELIKNTIIVVKRNDIKINLDIPKIITINKNFGDISSTMIRNNISQNKYFLNEMVYNYIIKNRLYNKKGV